VLLSKVTVQGSIQNGGEQTPLCRNVRVYGPEATVLCDVVTRGVAVVAVRWLEEPIKYPTPAPTTRATTSRTATNPFLNAQLPHSSLRYSCIPTRSRKQPVAGNGFHNSETRRKAQSG